MKELKSPFENALEIIQEAKEKSWTSLDLSKFKLDAVPDEIGQLISLEALNLSYNNLISLPITIGQLENLKLLLVNHNLIITLPANLGNLKKLKKLDIQENGLRFLPEEICQLDHLEELICSDNKINNLPDSIGQLKYLNKFDLTKNRLKVLPETICQLKNLNFLNITENQLSKLPTNFGLLENLEDLILSNNKLSSLPDNFDKLYKLRSLVLSFNHFSKVEDVIIKLSSLQSLYFNHNRLDKLNDSFAQIKNLKYLQLSYNAFRTFPEVITKLQNLSTLKFDKNLIKRLPDNIGQLSGLVELSIKKNELFFLPDSIGELKNLISLDCSENRLTTIPVTIRQLKKLSILNLSSNQLPNVIQEIGQLTNLEILFLSNNIIDELPDEIGQLKKLRLLNISQNKLNTLPNSFSQLLNLEILHFQDNKFETLPLFFGSLPNLSTLLLNGNPLNPEIKSAYQQGLDYFLTFLKSLKTSEYLFEARLVLVGEGKVGKTTLLKALSGQGTREDEPTTHGVNIEVHSLDLPHPLQEGVSIQFNGWDFGGQEVYRVTHQFFFSPGSVYLVVWEPRLGVQQCQVEEWIKLIRLRVGDEARIIIVSTHAKSGQRIARIDKPAFLRDYGSIILDFVEVDSMEDDPETGDKYGLATLKHLIAKASVQTKHMGMLLNPEWKAARNEIIHQGKNRPRLSFSEFASICGEHNLGNVEAFTLVGLMHDLGYLVYYGSDEILQDEIVLQPEWLTKAIGFVLEDRGTQERDGVLPDQELHNVWFNHPFTDEPKFEPSLYPFFLRLMEKYDVIYRLPDGNSSLVAQHVPQVQPVLPWYAEEEPIEGKRRLSMLCVMDEAPAGLIPWMIVRTHGYTYELNGHRLHWQKGMFLKRPKHGEALLELRGRELHINVEATWPDYFMNVLQQTLTKLIADNWPGMSGRYSFNIPCPENVNGEMCQGRFPIDSLKEILDEGDETIRCLVCRKKQNIVEMLYGFEDEEIQEQLLSMDNKLDQRLEMIQKQIEGFESRLAHHAMSIMYALANEAKDGPRIFSIQPLDEKWYHGAFKNRFKLQVWCEAEGCQHPVVEEGKGSYEFEKSRDWVKRVAPYANFATSFLKTMLPMLAPAINTVFGDKTFDNLGIKAQIDLMKEIVKYLPDDVSKLNSKNESKGILSDDERSGLLELHALLKQFDPHHSKLGLRRVPTYTGDYQWLCKTHYEESLSNIPDKIEFNK